MINTAKAEALRLLNELPRPESYELPAGADEKEIVSAERRIGFQFPDEFKDWLKCCNGPCIGPGGLFGINTASKFLDLEACLAAHREWVHKRLIPVASDGCGNFFILVPTEEPDRWPVAFFDSIRSEMNASYVVASSLWHFLRFLFLKELKQTKWPFAKDEVTLLDPEILSIKQKPLPWETR